jgi:integrase
LTRSDIHWTEGQLFVESDKFRGSRLLPLDESTLKASRNYDRFRHQYRPDASSQAFFLTQHGTALKYWRTFMAFSQIRRSLGWDQLRPQPRIHDLRHTFAVRCLLKWYRQGDNIDQRMPALQTYLGHKKITDTYWYLSAIPELMAQAASRFDDLVQTERSSPQ